MVRELGLAYIVAKEEAGSQIGALYQAGKVYAVITEDADMYAHAVRRFFLAFVPTPSCGGLWTCS